jgi:hypothetical protein
MQMDMSMVQTSTQYTVLREQRLASNHPQINVTQDTHGLFKTVEGVFMQSRSAEDEIKRRCNDADRLRQDLQRALQENEKLKAKTLEEERSRISDSTVRLARPRTRPARLAPPRRRGATRAMHRLTASARADEGRAPQQPRDHGRDRRHADGAQGASRTFWSGAPRAPGPVLGARLLLTSLLLSLCVGRRT